MRAIRSDSFSESNSVGANHAENQDTLVEDPEKLIFAVADGVGGYSGAKIASSIAIEVLESNALRIVDEDSFRDVITTAHRAVQEKASELGFANMGTTLAAAKVLREDDSTIVLSANVGDSPILLFSGGTVKSVYVDDSHRSRDPRAMFGITQYLGLDLDLDIHVVKVNCREGDILLLCSDGITDNLVRGFDEYGELSKLMLNHPSAERIVKKALQIGLKPDDMTAVLVFF